jgi:hypothetical protein
MYHPSKKIGENKRQPISINIEELLDIEELPDQEAMAVVGGLGGTGSYEDRKGLKNISGNFQLLSNGVLPRIKSPKFP